MLFQETPPEETPEEEAEAAKSASEQLADAAAEAEAAAQQLSEASTNAASLAEQLARVAEASGISEFVFLATIFVLAIFVGYYVVWSVTPALHTPLMSVTNAVSSVVVVGALIAVGADISQSPMGGLSKWLGVGAVALASVNIFGGFLVTQRMLAMYKKKES
ncbi:MAG: NAD(P) transhydrogenase subunit alpha [Pseudomonadota bacterium]